MEQTRLVSGIETICDTASGFVVSLIVWQGIAAPIWGYDVTIWDNIGLTSLFTGVSMTRKYLWRRFFANGLHRRLVAWVSGKRSTTSAKIASTIRS